MVRLLRIFDRLRKNFRPAAGRGDGAPPYNSGMKDLETVVASFMEEERVRRNEELRARLREGRSFEELLLQLAMLKGFNVEERSAA